MKQTEEGNAVQDNLLYTIAEVSALLKVNKNTVYDLIRNGHLKSIKFGCRKVTRKALLAFLDDYVGITLTLKAGDDK